MKKSRYTEEQISFALQQPDLPPQGRGGPVEYGPDPGELKAQE